MRYGGKDQREKIQRTSRDGGSAPFKQRRRELPDGASHGLDDAGDVVALVDSFAFLMVTGRLFRVLGSIALSSLLRMLERDVLTFQSLGLESVAKTLIRTSFAPGFLSNIVRSHHFRLLCIWQGMKQGLSYGIGTTLLVALIGPGLPAMVYSIMLEDMLEDFLNAL